MTPRLAFISGAGSGLGKELAFLLAQKKIPLFLTSKDPGKLEAVEKQLQGLTSVFSAPADLTVQKDIDHLLELIRQKAPDLVINNAGCGLYGEVLSFTLDQQMKILKINIDALLQISIESARILKEEKETGTIMNIASAASFFTYPSFALYAASKRFVKEFSLSFDEELSSHGIRVLTCLPGRFQSDFRYNASSHKQKSPSSPSWDTMSLRSTAEKILKQIEQKKRCKTIDWRYQIACHIALLLPRRWLAKLLKKGIDEIIIISKA